MSAKKEVAGFDASGFLRAKLRPQELDVRIAALAPFFPDGADPVWTVRGLTAAELATVTDAQNRAALVARLERAEGDDARIQEVLRTLSGKVDPHAQPMFIKAVETLVLGSVSPECDHALAVKLSEVMPSAFYGLVKHINDLTNEGCDLGKLKPSGADQKSGPASP